MAIVKNREFPAVVPGNPHAPAPRAAAYQKRLVTVTSLQGQSALHRIAHFRDTCKCSRS